ncbi:MAG: DUF6398 domain-containing protein [Actinomycetota bacterium]|nr:DUF6398 domain-containing protein [Actinomycetota bacterium]
MDDVGRALADEHPLALLTAASMLLAVVDPRNRDPFERQGEGSPRLDWERLLGSLLEVDLRETTALLAAFAEMTPDEVAGARIRRELAIREHPLPAWLLELGQVQPYRAVEMVHVLGDGENVLLGVRFPTGHEMAVVAYIDHNLGTVVKDAFVVPESLAELVEFMRKKSGDDPDTVWDDLDAADARVRITEAIETGAMTVPRFETDTWPACRPLVEWVTRLLPLGGRGYVRPEWDEAAKAALASRFLASPFAAGLDDDHVDLLEQVLWFATDYGPGDPLRWSPVAVEILLADWIPRKIVADAAYLSKAPDVLRAFVRFCHDERGIRTLLTNETLAAVDQFEPDYQRIIRSPRPQGPAALLAAIGVLDPDGPWTVADAEPFDYREVMIDTLRRAVGGDAALDELDDRPLPDEEISWDGIPVDIRPTVAEVSALCDRCCAELLDTEYRSACRRFLSVVASGDPAVFRRRARPDTAAAAVCWTVGKANELFSPAGGGMRVKDLMAHFGLHQGGVSQRASTLLRAGGFSTEHYHGVDLGKPELLVSSRRRSIIERRKRYQSLLDDV